MANPNMFAARFMVMEPRVGWLAGTSGINLAHSGFSPTASRLAKLLCSTVLNRPNPSVIIPISPMAISTAKADISKVAATKSETTSMLLPLNHCQQAAAKGKRKNRAPYGLTLIRGSLYCFLLKVVLLGRLTIFS